MKTWKRILFNFIVFAPVVFLAVWLGIKTTYRPDPEIEIRTIIIDRTAEEPKAVPEIKVQDNAEEAEEEPQLRSLGQFYLTVYCPGSDGGRWGYLTATPGVTSKHLQTCAVDPSVIPLGTTLYIGDLELQAVDTGSAVKGHKIDIFYDGPADEAIRWLCEFGTDQEVYVA